MRLLVDTHLLLWAAARSRRLPRAARVLLEDATNQVFYSAASLWEIAIKLALRREGFAVDVKALRPALAQMGFEELTVTSVHAEGVVDLPSIHRDPFDRMLVAQSQAEALRLLTNDAVLAKYSDQVIVAE